MHRLPRRSPRVAAVGAVVSLALLVAACQGAPAPKVGPTTVGPATVGPTTAATKAARYEAREGTRSVPAPAATCTNAQAGWSAREGRKAGAGDLPTHNPGVGRVGGYLDSFTAVCGQTLSVHLSSYGGDTRVRLRALRIGDYRGRTSRLVWQSPVLTAHQQQEAVPAGRSRVVRERWPVATAIPVHAGWPPGMYFIEIVPVGQGQSSFIPLVVRTSGVRSPYLVVISDLTWLAYNTYGSSSLYLGPGNTHRQQVANRSYVASVDRPVSGSGLRSVFAMDVPLVKFLSRKGVSYDVTTDSSLDATPAQLVGQPTVLIGGHSEYWTRRMYDAALQARDAGTNFGFLGANAIYWQGRIERDPGGRASALTVYRLAALDLPARADPAKTTVHFAVPGAGRINPSVGTPYMSPVELARTLPMGGGGPGGEG